MHALPAAGTVTTYEVDSRTLCLPYPSNGFAALVAAPAPALGLFLGAMPAMKGSLLSLDGELPCLPPSSLPALHTCAQHGQLAH